MTLALELPPCPDSWLGRLDARWRLAGLLLLTALTAALRSLPMTGLALCLSLLLAALGRVNWVWYGSRLLPTLALLCAFTALLPVLVDGSPAWSLGPVRFTWPGFRLALLVCTKAATILTLMLIVLTSAPLPTTLKAAHRLRLPSLLVQLVVLTYRYTFVLADELARLRVALRVRGFRARASRRNYQTIGRVAGTLLVRGYERAERVGQAMRSRGFDGRFRALVEFRTAAIDVAAFCLLTAAAAALLAGDLLLH